MLPVLRKDGLRARRYFKNILRFHFLICRFATQTILTSYSIFRSESLKTSERTSW